MYVIENENLNWERKTNITNTKPISAKNFEHRLNSSRYS